MKNILSIITRFALAVGSVLMMASCEDYLDKNPESNVNKEDAFKNFNNFQGYIEEIYNCIPDRPNATGLHHGILGMTRYRTLTLIRA